jgi:hypothetical protein
MSSKTLTALVWLFLFLPALGVPSQTQDMNSAREFAQQVYASYADPDVAHQEQRQDRLYTPQLRRLIHADRTGHPGDVGKLDGDPICDCQDPGDPGQLKVSSIDLSATTPSRMKAAVRFTIVAEPRAITLILIKTQAGWRIDDIATKEIPSLRAFLSRP